MKIKAEKSSSHFVSTLRDEELFSAIMYTKGMIKKSNSFYSKNFKDVCFFLFENDHLKAEKYLETVIEMYFQEYMKRRLN